MKTAARLLAAFPLVLAIRPAAAENNLVVRSLGECPSAAAVRDALWAIRPDREWPSLTATIEVVQDRVRVSFAGDPELWREVSAPPDCADRVNRAALVIAAWSGDLPAQTADTPQLAITVPPPLPVAVPVAAAKTSAAVFELGGSGFYSLTDGAVPGARIELARLSREGWWGIRAAAAYQWSRSFPVDIGTTQQDRTLLGLALVLQWNFSYLYFSSDWGMVGAFVRAHGNGYTQNQSASGFNLGLDAQGRVGVRLRSLRIYVDSGLYRWLGRETIRIETLSGDSSSSHTLSRWDTHLGLGAGVLFD
jgi:hypothetical protein